MSNAGSPTPLTPTPFVRQICSELGFAYTVADKVLFMPEARIREQGTPSEVLTYPKQDGTKNFLRGHGTFRLPEPQID